MTVPRDVDDPVRGLGQTRRAYGDGTFGGRVRSATRHQPRPIGGDQIVTGPQAGPSTFIDTLALTADSQQIASGGDYVTWHNELVGLTPRQGFDGYGGPSETITIPADGRLLPRLHLDRSSGAGSTAWTVRWHVTRGGQVLTDTVVGPTSGGVYLDDHPGLSVKAGDVLRIQIVQASGGAETLDSARLDLTLIRIAVNTTGPQLLFSADVWGLIRIGSAWWTTEGDGLTVTERDANGAAVSSFEASALESGGGLQQVRGIAYDGTHLWLSGADDVLARYSTAGVLQTEFALEDVPGGHLGVAWDGTHVWVIDGNNREAERYTTAGALDTKFSLTGTVSYRGMTFHNGDLWMLTNDRQLERWTTAGVLSDTVDLVHGGLPATPAPTGVWISDAGRVFLSIDDVGVYDAGSV